MFDFGFLKKIPILSFTCGWWDIFLAQVCVSVKSAFRRSIQPDDYVLGSPLPPAPHWLEHCLEALFLVCLIRSMYAWNRYIPYGRRGRTLWYPLADLVGIYLIGVLCMHLLYEVVSLPNLFGIPTNQTLRSMLDLTIIARILPTALLLINNVMGAICRRCARESRISVPIALNFHRISHSRKTQTLEGNDTRSKAFFDHKSPGRHISASDRPALPRLFPPWRRRRK